MNTIDVNEETLFEIVESVWAALLNRSITPCSETKYAPNSQGLTVCVHIVGEWNGTVMYMPSEVFSCSVAAQMLSVPVDSVGTDEIRDAAAELCNIVAGSLKGVLPGPSSLSLPTVSEGANYEVRVRNSHPLWQISFQCEGDVQQIAVFEAELPNPTSNFTRQF